MRKKKKGTKTDTKTRRKYNRRDDTTSVAAQIHKVSERYVRMVRSGECSNENIMATVIDYNRGKNLLIKHLEKLVPIL